MGSGQRLVRGVKVFLDLGILTATFLLACWIRFEGAVPPYILRSLPLTLPCVVAVQFLALLLCGPRRSSWRYIGLSETLRLVGALTLAGVVLGVWRGYGERLSAVLAFRGERVIPWGVLLFDLPLGCMGLIGVRVVSRLRSEYGERSERRPSVQPRSQPTPTFLIGAGRAGAYLARELLTHPDAGIIPVGFLDDNFGLHGLKIGGVPVLGPIARVGDLAERYRVKQALLALPGGPSPTLRRIARLCKEAGLAVKIVPSLCEIVRTGLDVSSVRNIAIEDLLRREPIRLDEDDIHASLRGRRVLVTGAGGSIGSELCHKICTFGAATLILVEQAENSLFQIHRQLVRAFPSVRILPCLADICDTPRMRHLFASLAPEMVFHAAAHKHVPLMESNAGEAIKNNVLGTAGLVRLAHSHGVERFVMISTDKAVKPASVMGASKRVAELYVQAFAKQSATRFVTVRFGNVLGSNGSVVPLFQEQIARGGPVTVTHPDMSRYFMTIPEACQLVLQAAVMGRGGEIFILDMGEPVKIVDLARDLICLSGLVPGRDVEIRFTGLRCGEKLTEELFSADEDVGKTAHPRIRVGRKEPPAWSILSRQIEELGALAIAGEGELLHAKLSEIVPDYRPQSTGSEGDIHLPDHAALETTKELAVLETRTDGVPLGAVSLEPRT